MTISSTTRVAGPFPGSGTVSTFPFEFKVFEASDLDVVTLNTATGTIATLALTTDYTVTLNADQDTNPGGSITLTAGNLATGYTLTITTDIAALQGLDLANGGGFYPDVINAALDLLTILVQQLALQSSFALQVPLVDGTAPSQLPPAAARAGKLLMFDSNGNPSLISIAAGGTVPGAQSAAGTVNGVNRTFTFSASAASTPAPLVFAGGIFQSPTDYSVPVNTAGSTWQIVFTAAPTQGPVTILLFA